MNRKHYPHLFRLTSSEENISGLKPNQDEKLEPPKPKGEHREHRNYNK